MAKIPDQAFLDSHEVSDEAHLLFGVYCMRRNHKSGGYTTSKEDVLAILSAWSESKYFRYKRELVEKKWIVVNGDFVTPIKGFQTSKNDTESSKNDSEATVKNDSQTCKNDSKTSKNDSPTVKNDSALHIVYQPVTSQIPDITIFAETAPENSKKVSGVKKGLKKEKKPTHPDFQRGMDFLHTTLGEIVSGGAQGKSLNAMFSTGYTIEEVEFYFPLHVKEFDALGYTPSYTTLQKQIRKLKLAHPIRPPTKPEDSEYELIVRESKRDAVRRHANKPQEVR